MPVTRETFNYLCTSVLSYEMQRGIDENLRPDGEMMTMYSYGSKTWFLSVLAPSVSIKDRPLLAVLIGDGTVLTAYRE